MLIRTDRPSPANRHSVVEQVVAKWGRWIFWSVSQGASSITGQLDTSTVLATSQPEARASTRLNLGTIRSASSRDGRARFLLCQRNGGT